MARSSTTLCDSSRARDTEGIKVNIGAIAMLILEVRYTRRSVRRFKLAARADVELVDDDAFKHDGWTGAKDDTLPAIRSSKSLTSEVMLCRCLGLWCVVGYDAMMPDALVLITTL